MLLAIHQPLITSAARKRISGNGNRVEATEDELMPPHIDGGSVSDWCSRRLQHQRIRPSSNSDRRLSMTSNDNRCHKKQLRSNDKAHAHQQYKNSVSLRLPTIRKSPTVNVRQLSHIYLSVSPSQTSYTGSRQIATTTSDQLVLLTATSPSPHF